MYIPKQKILTYLDINCVSKDLPVDNMRETELNGYVYDFSVDYYSIDVNDIVEIHKYLMKRHDIK